MRNLRNSVQLIGHLGDDPEFQTYESNRSRAKFRLATNDGYTMRDGKKEQVTNWHTIIAWGKTAKYIADYFKKGNHVAVEGKLTYRQYDDPTGHTKYYTEIVVSEVVNLSYKKMAA